MTKCKIVYGLSGLLSDLEDAINDFIAGKEIISVSYMPHGRYHNALIIYKED